MPRNEWVEIQNDRRIIQIKGSDFKDLLQDFLDLGGHSYVLDCQYEDSVSVTFARHYSVKDVGLTARLLEEHMSNKGFVVNPQPYQFIEQESTTVH